MRVVALGVTGVGAVTLDVSSDAVVAQVTRSTAEVAVSAAKPLAKLQAELALVEDLVKENGKVTPQVKRTVRRLISMVTKLVEPAIKSGHTTDALLLGTVHEEIVACDVSYSGHCRGAHPKCGLDINVKKRGCDKAAAAVEATKASFGKCISGRDMLVENNQTKCCREYAMCPGNGHCENVKLSQGFASCNYRIETGKECYMAARKLVSNLKGYFRGQDERYETYRKECAQAHVTARSKIQGCKALHVDLKAKIASTAEYKKILNRANSVCTRNDRSKWAHFSQCRKTTEARFAKTVGPCKKVACNKPGGCPLAGGNCVLNRCADRKDEWHATATVKCMLIHYLEGGKFQTNLLKRCKAKISSSHLHCHIPKVPTKRSQCMVTQKHCSVPALPAHPFVGAPKRCYAPPPPVKTQCLDRGQCPGWCKKNKK